MSAASPRQQVHRGSVVACGYAIDVASLGVVEARQRALALWVPGARILDDGELLAVLELPAHRVRTERAPGLPLVDVDGVVTSAPLTADERAALPTGAVIVVRGGVVRVIPASRTVDVAKWVALGEVEVPAVAALASPPRPAAAPAAPVVDARSLLGVGASAEGAGGLAAALARAEAGAADGAMGSTAGDAGARPSRWQRLIAWLAQRLAQAGDRETPPAAADGTSRTAGGGTSTALVQAAPSWWSRLRARLAEAAWRSRLGELLGRRHAEYLQKMLDMFDRGDLDEALRYAIPLGGASGPTEIGLTQPRPRDQLAPSLQPHHGQRVLPVAETATEQIRQRYLQALDRLVRADRIDEAAFVLADLLGDVAGAVALLERHGRFALAAQLALGRGLEPGLAVRLWWLAGERERAIATARRHGAWANGIGRLEQAGEVDTAATLRLAWADHLATTGAYAAAAQLAARIPTARALVLTWVERGLALGGTDAGRLLVLKASLAPERFAEVAAGVTVLVSDLGPDGVTARRGLAEALIEATAAPALAPLARLTVRALARDIGRGADGDAPMLLPRLVRVADDAALRTDLPALHLAARAPTLVDRDTPLVRRWSASDRGAIEVHDAARLPGGRVLLALGELGVRLLGRDGATLATFDQPATALVIGDGGGHALATIRRGGYLRVARLDLATRRGRWWCDAECDGGADTYNGDVWLTSRGGEVLAIDVTAARWSATWGVDTGSAQCAVTRDGDRFSVLTNGVGVREAWHYQGYTLRERTDLTAAIPDRALLAIGLRPATQTWFGAALPNSDDARPAGTAELLWPGGRVILPLAAPHAVATDPHFLAALESTTTGVTMAIVHPKCRMVVAHLDLDGAVTARLRFAERYATVCDDRGRVLIIDLRAGAVPFDRRIAP